MAHPFNGKWRVVITEFLTGSRSKGTFDLVIDEMGSSFTGSFTAEGGGSVPLKKVKISNTEINVHFDAVLKSRFHGFISPELSSGATRVICGIFVVPNIKKERAEGDPEIAPEGQNDGTWTGTQP